MAALIEQFALAWHPNTGCAYRIKPMNGVWTNWRSVTASDLTALASIFAEHPVYLHPDGAITTGAEPVG